MADYNMVTITPIEENFRCLLNWKAHILLTMLKTSHRLGMYPPIVREIFKERDVDATVNDSSFPAMMEKGYVRFIKLEVDRLIDYVCNVFDFNKERFTRNLNTEIQYTPATEYLKDDRQLEALALMGIGQVMFAYTFMK